jgi:hypothetical protein
LKKTLALTASCLSFALVLSCGDDGNGPGPTPPAAWGKVKINAAVPAVATSVVMASDGTAHMAFMDNTGMSSVVYATYKDGGLSVNSVGSSRIGAAHGATLALDRGNAPHIAFYGGPPSSNLFYNNMRGSGFVTVDDDGKVGRWPSIKADSDKRPRISYYDASQGDLRYARYDGSRWRIEVLDDADDTGLQSSLALDDNGNVAFYDAGATNFKYAHKSGGDWTTSIVENCYDAGGRCGLALGPDDKPHVTYYNPDEGSVYYAYMK